MQSTRKDRRPGLALKIASIVVAAAAVSVYAAKAPHRPSVIGEAHAAAPVAKSPAPVPAVVAATETWSADESAAGVRPDAAH